MEIPELSDLGDEKEAEKIAIDSIKEEI